MLRLLMFRSFYKQLDTNDKKGEEKNHTNISILD